MTAIPSQKFDRFFPFWLRAFVRARETGLVVVALVIGVGTGLLVAAIGTAAQRLHELLFQIPWNSYLSIQPNIVWWRLLMGPVLGAIALGLLALWAGKRFQGRMADAIEANALHGGRMSLAGSVFITVQTFISNACGVSVGQEAAYTQISSAFASVLGRGLAARRSDMRLLVGCGAAGAIAAAFGAPLAGAFYAFEVILGAYNVASLVPVVASAVAASIVSAELLNHVLLPVPASMPSMSGAAFAHVFVLAIVCSFASIVLMKMVALAEATFEKSRLPEVGRTLLGALIVGGMAIVTPQVMGSGHGALQINVAHAQPLNVLLMVLALKSLASAVSLGSGFRGGLFFASLLLGSILGRVYSEVLSTFLPAGIDPVTAAIAGMAAFGTGVVGAPITMTVLALETTGDFSVTVGALVASAIAALVVREGFGYSFATWRFHLRGETIRGPYDVGWMRDLNVARLMRKDARLVPQDMTIEAARVQFPLGSEKQFFLVDKTGRYAGIVITGDLYASMEKAAAPVANLALLGRPRLLPEMNIRETLDSFESHEIDVLPVIDDDESAHVLGLVTEAHALRRYGEELERRNRDIIPR